MKIIIKVVLTIFLFTSYTYAQVGINTTTSGSILDISSSDKGVLFPNIALTSTTVTSPVSSPTMGLLNLIQQLQEVETHPLPQDIIIRIMMLVNGCDLLVENKLITM